MRTPPSGFPEDHLARLLAAAWRFHVADIRYAPVGFGSHHWVAVDASGDKRFVTVDELDDPDEGGARGRFDRLRHAMRTAHILRDQAGLSCVVAPLPTVDGSVLCSLDGHAVAVFPFVGGDAHPSGDEMSPQQRVALVDVLAQLHGATPSVTATAGADDLEIPDREELVSALDRLREPWSGGPFAEGTRELLRSQAGSLRAALTAYDRMAAEVRARGVDQVVTHGEPKADNLLVTDAGLRLVDWDTTLLAPAARDLWLVDAGSGAELSQYAELTGRHVTSDEMTLFRLRWELADIASFTCWLGRPHRRTPDTEIAWRSLSGYLQGMPDRWPALR